MKDFDTLTLLDFDPPKYKCEKCLALFTDKTIKTIPRKKGERRVKCPICKAEYLAEGGCFPPWQLDLYLKSIGNNVEIDDPLEQSRKLAYLAMQHKNQHKQYPPLRVLLTALDLAEDFVHFVSFKVSDFMVGALKLAAQRIKVRGIVSGVDKPKLLAELQDYNDEAPFRRFQVKAFGAEKKWEDMPHTKVVVIDGLLAFKGSANLTVPGWRKAADNLEMIEVETKVSKIIDLHNRYFSPIWAKLSELKDELPMVLPPS